MNVGAREGVCRDFAVLGYCARGLDCDKQHVRECPDFAEKGTCSTKGCKLPHVIRANRNRKPASTVTTAAAQPLSPSAAAVGGILTGTDDVSISEEQYGPRATANEAQLGDEYISLTFNESESESEEESDAEEEDDDDDDDEGEEGSDPNLDDDREMEPE